MIGFSLFTATSLACALARGTVSLIGATLLQGVGAALPIGVALFGSLIGGVNAFIPGARDPRSSPVPSLWPAQY